MFPGFYVPHFNTKGLVLVPYCMLQSGNVGPRAHRNSLAFMTISFSSSQGNSSVLVLCQVWVSVPEAQDIGLSYTSGGWGVTLHIHADVECSCTSIMGEGAAPSGLKQFSLKLNRKEIKYWWLNIPNKKHELWINIIITWLNSQL